MLPKYKARLFDYESIPGSLPAVRNPKPNKSYRPVALKSTGWTFLPDRYGPVHQFMMQEVQDVSSAIMKFEDLLRRNPSHFVVYVVTRNGPDTCIGAVAFQGPPPLDFRPVPFSIRK